MLSTLPIGPNDERLWAVLSALRRNVSPEELSRRTGIDPWFLRAFERITNMEKRLIHEHLDQNLMYEANIAEGKSSIAMFQSVLELLK